MNEVKRTVYVDMDGVLADFDKGFFNISGGKHAENTPNSELWKIIENYGKVKFFTELPWMSGGQALWNFVTDNFLKVKILSACGRNSEVDKETPTGKLTWLRHHLNHISMDDIILVTNKHKKRHYSMSGDIIIDDTPVVIHEWVKKGGIGILHEDSSKTISILKSMSNKTQISELKLKDLVKTVWNKLNYVEDPPHVVQRMHSDNPVQLDLPMNVPDTGKRQGFKSKRNPKAKQQTFDFLKDPIQMPKYISKKDWKIGFDLTKSPFYTDQEKWYADNVKEKYSAKEKEYIDTYIGEDLTMYGFPYKTNGELPNNKFTYGKQLMYIWNKAKAHQVYYETKIANYLKQKQQSKPNLSNN